jgi:hypothetical protein
MLEARDIAEAAGVNVTDVNTAATFAGLIADDTGELAVGVATNAAPDFILITPILKANAVGISPVANTTSVTLTRTTATSSWSVAYILGYTA